jgi:translation initiation factor IF-3
MATRRRRFRNRPKPTTKKPLANEEITAPEVRLIGPEGEQLGIVSLVDARARAVTAESDLVMVAAKAAPPVVRILDLGKHIYEKRKKEAKQKTKGKGGDTKGIRLGFKTDEHDWNMRLKQASKFLQEGHRVKLEMRLRGREKSRPEMAATKITDFIQHIEGGAKMEGPLSRSPRGVLALVTKN